MVCGCKTILCPGPANVLLLQLSPRSTLSCFIDIQTALGLHTKLPEQDENHQNQLFSWIPSSSWLPVFTLWEGGTGDQSLRWGSLP